MHSFGFLLSKINTPEDLRKLKKRQLAELAEELRKYIIEIVSEKGGHLSSNLGVIELTVALHYVFNTPYDQLVWDVGHQAYGHKILTRRKTIFDTNRKLNGISGFPKRSESEYDTFGVGHSSTSISAALGMAVASRLKGDKNRQHIAVIGDGALTAGLAFEGLDNAGIEDSNLLIILNDNNMSIDPNVGALRSYLSKHVFSEKGNDNLFKLLNFQYFGPVDGHDINQLLPKLEELKTIPGPKILHCLTKKGKGYLPAEKGNASQWHSPGLFDKVTGKINQKEYQTAQPPKFQEVFGKSLLELAKKNDKIVGITPAMPSGSSLNIMMKKMPERTFDVSIAEQHAVTFSAGLATQGLIPFCTIYSTFLQRAYDQIIHDVAIQNLHVVFCIDRAGLVGADGATHHGAYDIAFLRCIPNMVISAPLNEEEMRNLMFTAQLEKNNFPFSIRYPRGKGVMPEWEKPFKEIQIGTGRKVISGEDIAILSIGTIGNEAIKAAKELQKQGVHAAVYDMRFVKPLDEKLLKNIFSQYDKIITVEDGCIKGGFGSAILEYMSENNLQTEVVCLGIPDKVIEHGSQEELRQFCAYDAEGIKQAVLKRIK